MKLGSTVTELQFKYYEQLDEEMAGLDEWSYKCLMWSSVWAKELFCTHSEECRALEAR